MKTGGRWSWSSRWFTRRSFTVPSLLTTPLFHSQQCLRRVKCPNTSRSQSPAACRHTVHTHHLLQWTQSSLPCWDLLLPHLLPNYLQLHSFFTWRCIWGINTLRNVSCSRNYRLLPGQRGIPGSWATFLPQDQRLPAPLSRQDPQCFLAWHGWDGTRLWEHCQRLPHNPSTRWPCLRHPSSFQKKTLQWLICQLIWLREQQAKKPFLPLFPTLHHFLCSISYFSGRR